MIARRARSIMYASIVMEQKRLRGLLWKAVLCLHRAASTGDSCQAAAGKGCGRPLRGGPPQSRGDHLSQVPHEGHLMEALGRLILPDLGGRAAGCTEDAQV